MIDVIDNLSRTEYLLTFLTFIYSFIATQFFNGWGKWIQNIDNDKPSFNHALFSLLVFVLLIDFWWISFPRGIGMSQNLPTYFASLISPIIFSVLTFNIFPRGRTEDANLAAYFVRRSRFIFIVLGCDFLINIFVDYLLMNSPLLGAESYFRLVGVTFCIIGAYFPDRAFIITTLLTLGIGVLILHIVVFGNPPPPIMGYSFAEYLTIFTTLIFGVIASRFISGWSHILQHIKTIQFSKEHFGWSLFAFVLLIDYWWGFWPRMPFIIMHLGFFLLTLLLPILFYALVVVLFPFKKYLDKTQLHDYFDLHHRWIVILIGAILFVNTITANVMEDQWLSKENMYRFVGLLLALGILLFPHASVRRFGLITGSLVLVIHTILQA